jgi:hypothetical protein
VLCNSFVQKSAFEDTTGRILYIRVGCIHSEADRRLMSFARDCFLPVKVCTYRDHLMINAILIIKPTRCTKFSNLFWNETLYVSDSYSVHHQEFFTIYTAMVYVLQVCWQLSSRLILLASCLQNWMTYTIAVCTVKNSWWWTEELSETCRFSFQNKF